MAKRALDTNNQASKGLQALFKEHAEAKRENSQADSLKNKMLTNNSGVPRSNSRENVRLILTQDSKFKGLLRFNVFDETIEYRSSKDAKFEPMEDISYSKIATQIERYYRFIPSAVAINDGVTQASLANKYNPIKERIEKAKWDGKKRVATFFIKFLGAENNQYTRAVTETWFTGLIARAYKPGCKVDIVPILYGAQGIGKSSLLSLLPPKGYFEDNLQTSGDHKDDLLKVQSSWLIEIGELKAFDNSSFEQIKAFLTATSDKYRSPYGRVVKDHPRKCVFIGTTNKQEYLGDLTGNRRFYPINCNIDNATMEIPNINDKDNYYILQVLAEAKVMFDKGHSLKLSDEIEEYAHRKQADATIIDTDIEQIKEFASLLVPANWDKYTIYQRQQYWQRVHNEQRYAKYDNSKKEYIDIPKDELHPIKEFATVELLSVVFNENSSKTSKGGSNSLARKISLYFDNKPNWKRTSHITLLGNRKRGFKRT